MPEQQSEPKYKNVIVGAFPSRLLFISLLFTIAVVMWMGGNSYYIHHFLTHTVTAEQNLADLGDEILYLDDVIRQAVQSGNADDEFERQLLEAEKTDLADKINQVEISDLREMARNFALDTSRIIELQKEYSSLERHGKVEQALKIVNGNEYNELKKDSLDKRHSFGQGIRKIAHRNLLTLENNIYTTLLLVGVTVFILAIAWYFAFRSIYRWRHEITESARREIKLREAAELARQQAQAANEAKTDFLSNMSHELRTPMHAIMGYTDLGIKKLDKEKSPDVLKYLINTKTAADRLLRLINDLLDLSKLEAGKLNMEMAPTDLMVIIANVRHEMFSLLEGKNLKVDVIPPANPLVLSADAFRITQVIINIMSNAIRYSPKDGTISINVSNHEAEGNAGLLCRISNMGNLIPESELESIFDKFVQSSTTKSKAGGTGLGLSICRKIMELHGGRIWAENQPDGGGVDFYLFIPAPGAV